MKNLSNAFLAAGKWFCKKYTIKAMNPFLKKTSRYFKNSYCFDVVLKMIGFFVNSADDTGKGNCLKTVPTKA